MPQITFIKVSNDLSIPIKIFINRKNITSSDSSSTVSINQKSIVKLTKINYLKLSINDLNSLMKDIRISLIHNLVKRPLSELFELNEKGKINIDLNQSDWKCNLILSIEFLVNLRTFLNKLTFADLNLIHEKKINLNNLTNNNLSLLIKEIKYKFFENEDDKKAIDYKFNAIKVISNINNCLNLYINKIPVK